MTQPAVRVVAAIGTYPQTLALKGGRVPSPVLQFAFADVPVISRAFAPMVREGRYDVSEMAIATFLQARACGRPLVLLPVVLAQRFQEGALLCRADSAIRGPADLVGRRVGVRAYGQTTCMWLRGVLAGHGVAAEAIRWVTFEGAHVAEIVDPAWSERAPGGSDMLAMLRDGTLDAAIFGAETPADADLRPVFADPDAAGAAFRARYGVVPVNHMLCVRRDRVGIAGELMRVMAASAMLSDAPALPMGMDAVRPAVELALAFAQEQGLLPRRLQAAEVWEGLPLDILQEVTP